MLPAVKTMQAFVRATPRPRHPLQDHDSPPRRARLAAGPARSRGAAMADPPWSPPRTCPPRTCSSIPSPSPPRATARRWRGGRGRTAPGAGARTGCEPGVAPARRERVRRPSAPRRRAPSHVAAYAQTRAIALTDRAIGSATRRRARGCPSPSASTSGTFGSQRTHRRRPAPRPSRARRQRATATRRSPTSRTAGRRTTACMVSLRRAGGSFGAPFQVGHGRDPLGRGRRRPARRRARRLGRRAGRSAPATRARPARASSPSRRSRRTRPSSPRCRPRSPTAGAATWPGARSCSPRAAPAGRSSTRSPCGRRATASAPPSSSSATARTAARRRSPRLTSGRDASVAWTGFDGANARVRVASTDPRRASARRRTSRPPAATGWSPISRPRAGPASSSGTTAASTPTRSSPRSPRPARPSARAEAVSAAQEARAGTRGHGPRADRGVDQPARRLASPGRPGRRADLRPGARRAAG